MIGNFKRIINIISFIVLIFEKILDYLTSLLVLVVVVVFWVM